MDQQWAIERLENWVNLAEEYESLRLRSAAGARKTELLQILEGLQAQTTTILQRQRPNLNPQLLIPSSRGSTLVEPGLVAVKFVLGELRTEEETADRLGPTAPRMQAELMHPVVWEAASKLWDDGHYAQSVQRAATWLNAHVQDRVNRHDVSDASLMREAFSSSDPQAGKPRLRWPGSPDDLTVKSMNDGLRNYAPGCFMAIRNPSVHEKTEMAQQDALERLAALSLLARWVEECDVAEAAAT